MNKEELKNLLEDYWFDNQYLKEKSKEINNVSKLFSYSSSSQLLDDSLQYEEAQIKNILCKKQKVESLIQSLNQPYKTIMYMKYITFLTFDQIADRMNYSTKRIYQLNNEGLTKLLSNINNNEINISNY